MADLKNNKKKKICQIYDCNRAHHAHGYCSKHCIQMKRNGKINPMICEVDRCGAFVYAHGYCSKHYMQQRLHCKIYARTRFDPNEFRLDGNDCYISLYDRHGNFKTETIIDREDYKKIKGYKWCLSGNNYVMTNTSPVGLSLSRFLLSLPDGVDVDHIDGDTLNNRGCNLREATQAQNMANRGKQMNNTSGYKGVYLDKRRGTWCAKLEYHGKQLFLGSFSDKIAAAKAYDTKSIKLFDEFAYTNFKREA